MELSRAEWEWVHYGTNASHGEAEEPDAPEPDDWSSDRAEAREFPQEPPN